MSKYTTRQRQRQAANRRPSDEEEGVICLLLSGECASAKEIAHRLGQPVPTTYERLRRYRARIGVRSNAQLVAVLLRERMAV